MQIFLRLTLVAFCGAALAACGGARRGPNPIEVTQERAMEVRSIFGDLTPEETQRFQPDMRLGAVYREGFLYVAVRNQTNRGVQVEPLNFGLITPEGQLIPIKPGAAVSQFPTTKLVPGAIANGRFRFPDLGNLDGYFLFFRHPEVQSSRCRIREEPASP